MNSMLATSVHVSPGRDDTVILTLLSDGGSSICARLAPELVPNLAEALLAEQRRRALEAS
jgi:hypothetical protein